MHPWLLALGGLGLLVLVAAALDKPVPTPHPDASPETHAWYAFLAEHRELTR
jgi:hypothetical protein